MNAQDAQESLSLWAGNYDGILTVEDENKNSFPLLIRVLGDKHSC